MVEVVGAENLEFDELFSLTGAAMVAAAVKVEWHSEFEKYYSDPENQLHSQEEAIKDILEDNKILSYRQAEAFAARFEFVSSYSDSAFSPGRVPTGYRGGVFYDKSSNQAFFASSGTNDIVDFLTSDIQIGLTGVSKSAEEAMRFFELQLNSGVFDGKEVVGGNYKLRIK